MKRISKIDELKNRARAFAPAVVKLARALRKNKEAVLAAQFLRSGTSIGANLAEGRYTPTRADRLAKHAIALKEAGETLYWIELFEDIGEISPTGEFASLRADCLALIALLKEVIKYDRRTKEREAREAEALKPSRRKPIAVAIDAHDRRLEARRMRRKETDPTA